MNNAFPVVRDKSGQRLAKRRFLFFLLLLTPLLAACRERMVASDVRSYNHMEKSIGYFDINHGAGVGGGPMGPHMEGGSSCCIAIPYHWRPGLTVNITWADENDNIHSRDIEIPKYDGSKIATFAVHFLRNGEVRVLVPEVYFGHPDYPLKGPEAGLREGEDPIVDRWRY